MNCDFRSIKDGQRVRLIPQPNNPLHKKPVIATCHGGYFYCDGSDPADGPDYYWRDVGQYNVGFEPV